MTIIQTDANNATAGFIGHSDMRKVYLGQFVFNYRTAYFNGYRWPLGLHTRSNDLTTLKMQHHECYDLDNDLFLRLESGRLHGKMRECGLLTSVVQEPSELQIALAILFFMGTILIVAIEDPVTVGNRFLMYR